MARSFALAYPTSDIAVLTWDAPHRSDNLLTGEALRELAACLDEVEQREGLAGLVLASGKPGSFCAGADASRWSAAPDTVAAESLRVRTLLSRLARLRGVTVAAIDGPCLGGGAELALWCDRRVLSARAETCLAFPDLKLGVTPGWGGLVRAPRVLGFPAAVELLVLGEPLEAARGAALEAGGSPVPPDHLLEAALGLVRAEQASRDYLRDRARWEGPLGRSDDALRSQAGAALAVLEPAARSRQPAPAAALEALLASCRLSAEEAGRAETETLAGLVGAPVQRALLHVHFLAERVRTARWAAEGESERPPLRVGVAGAGVMGAGIAAACLRQGLCVSLADAAPEALARGAQQALAEAACDPRTRRTDPLRLLELAPRLTTLAGEQDFEGCGLVVESIVEQVDVKRRFFRRLEPRVPPDAVLATNTSTIPIRELAAALQRPERFCGLHFFNPVARMELVEVIRGPQTSGATAAAAAALVRRLGKLPIPAPDGPGFLVNRLLRYYLNESLELLRDGADREAVDRAAAEFGMHLGPLALYDAIGLDTALLAGRNMWEASPDKAASLRLLPALIRVGRLGAKTRAGFYAYEGDDPRPRRDPQVDALLAPYVAPPRRFSQEELISRLFLPILLEATRLLMDGLAGDVRDIDVSLIYGLGFPAHRGGLLYWADSLGPRRIVEMLAELQTAGPRMQPTPLLLELARTDGRFYDAAPRSPPAAALREAPSPA